jgi:hypothetical protein
MKPEREETEWSVDGDPIPSDDQTFKYQQEIKREGFCRSVYNRAEINRDRRVRNGQMAIAPILIGLVIGTTTHGIWDQILAGILLVVGFAWAVYWLTRPVASES